MTTAFIATSALALVVGWMSLLIRSSRIKDLVRRRPGAVEIPIPEPNAHAASAVFQGLVTILSIWGGLCLLSWPLGGDPKGLFLFGVLVLVVPLAAWAISSIVIRALGMWDVFTSFFASCMGVAAAPLVPLAALVA
jgi:hypothetical protein